MDEGLFWGFVAVIVILILLGFIMNGRKWAIVAFFGALLGMALASQIAQDNSIAVGYFHDPATGTTVFTTITSSISFPLEVLVILILFGFFVTLTKAFDLI